MNTESTYLNSLTSNVPAKQTIYDDYLDTMKYYIKDSEYIPIKHIRENTVLNSSMKINSNPDYLPANITIYYDGKKTNATGYPVLFPQTFSESFSTNYIKESPIGSTYPIVAFSHTQPTQIPFTFTILSEYLPAGYTNIRDYIKDLRQMVIPKYSGDVVQTPSVLVQFADVAFEGVCDSMSIEYAPVYGNKSFVKADVNCQFTVTKYK